MDRLTGVAAKEVRRLLASRPLLFLLVCWPVFYGLFLGAIYSARVVTKMPAAVCDDDNSYTSRLAVRYLGATRSLDLRFRARDAAELRGYILSGRAEAAIYIPRGFSSDIKRGKTGTITAFTNAGNLLIGNITLSAVKTVAGTIAAGARIKFLRKTGNSGAKALADYAPVKTEAFWLFNPGGNYLNYLVPGMWGMILQQLLLAFSSLLLTWEKDAGTLDASVKAAGGPAALIAGKALPYYLFFFGVFELFDLAIFPLFSVPLQGAHASLALLNALFIFAALGLGMFTSAVCRESMDAMKGVLLVGAPALLLSGYIWPISYMPAAVKPLAYAVPLTHYLTALRRVTQCGGPLSSALPQAGALLLTGVICFSAAWTVLKLRRAHD